MLRRRQPRAIGCGAAGLSGDGSIWPTGPSPAKPTMRRRTGTWAWLWRRLAGREAVEHLQRSIQLDPENGAAQHDLGLMLAYAGRLDEAELHFQRALDLDPQMDNARRNLEALRARRARP